MDDFCNTLCAAEFPSGTVDFRSIWCSAQKALQNVWGQSGYRLRDTNVELSEVSEYVSDTRPDGVKLEYGRNLVFSCGFSDPWGYSSVSMALTGPSDIAHYHQFLCELTSPAMVSWVYDWRYSKSQNESYVSKLEQSGRMYDRSKAYKDRRGKLRVRIDRNPGRRVLRKGQRGFTEMVASTMWLGPSFAERTGGDWRDMRQYDWCQITEHDNGLVRLESWPQPFDSDQGEQRERQDVLRRVLFPQSAAT